MIGYAMGILLAALLTTVAIGSQIGTDLLETMTSMLNPLPAIALLPLALIWFGLGSGSVIFVLVHSVLWAIALNTHAGFRSVSNTLRMVGRNYGLSGLGLVRHILIPAAFPSILTGLKVGWAFACRTLIAAELVFGVSSGSGGLGWYIFENRNQLETANVFAGLFTVIRIGFLSWPRPRSYNACGLHHHAFLAAAGAFGATVFPSGRRRRRTTVPPSATPPTLSAPARPAPRCPDGGSPPSAGHRRRPAGRAS